MRVTHVCPTVEREANGLSTAVLDMAISLRTLGVDVNVHTTGGPHPKPAETVSIYRHRSWRLPAQLRFAPRLRSALAASVSQIDVLHSHGLWTFPPAYAIQVGAHAKVPVVLTAHGAFNSWPMSKSPYRKKLAWMLMLRRRCRQATCLHATADAEIASYRRMGMTAPIAMIPLGIEAPAELLKREAQTARKLLFLGRIHPKKGIDLLLKSWQAVQHKALEWELHIVGPGEETYVSQLKVMSERLQCERVRFRGPAYGTEKSREYFSAEAYVLPSHDENFGLSVAESLVHGVPALVTHGAPWSGLNTQGCGWWVKSDVRAMADALLEVTSTDAAELAEMGMAGRQWMQNEYSMAVMGHKLRQLYEWMLGGGVPPSFVHCA